MPLLPWCDLPIIQAPVGSAAGADLCAAVSNAGGLGSMALTWRKPDAARELVLEVRGKTDRTFFANFVLHFEPRSLGAALDAGVPMITFSWGDPGPYVADVRSAGALLGLQATSAASALAMLEWQPDFLIVQGTEAGGHVQAHRPLVHTLLEVLGVAGSTPVFAAGGLATGADLARVMRLGAAGGVFGTRFVATLESEAHPGYRSRIVEASSGDTVLTSCFDGDWPYAMHRVLRNSTFDRWEAAGCPRNGLRPGEGDVVGVTASGAQLLRYEDSIPRLDTAGDWEAMALYAGTSVDRIDTIGPAADVVGDIWAQAQSLLAAG